LVSGVVTGPQCCLPRYSPGCLRPPPSCRCGRGRHSHLPRWTQPNPETAQAVGRGSTGSLPDGGAAPRLAAEAVPGPSPCDTLSRHLSHRSSAVAQIWLSGGRCRVARALWNTSLTAPSSRRRANIWSKR